MCIYEDNNFCSYWNKDIGSRETEYLCENCECFISVDPIIREAMNNSTVDDNGKLRQKEWFEY